MKNESKHHTPLNLDRQFNYLPPLGNDCLDFDSLFFLNDSNVRFKEKAVMIQHIYNCNSCHKLFSEFLELNDSIRLFSDRVHDFRSKRRNIFSRFLTGPYVFYHRRIISIATVAVLLFSVSLFMLFSPPFRSPSPSVTRASSSFLWSEIYPKPYSSIFRRSLFFAWSDNIQISRFRISIFDANLILLYETDFSSNRFAFLPQDLQKLFRADTFYFWCIKALTYSGNMSESQLFPFKVIE